MNQPSDDQKRNQESSQPSSLPDVPKSNPLNATIDHAPSASTETDIKREHETQDATVDFESTLDPQRSATSPPNRKTGLTNRQFGDYELLDEIARGGMGVVYKARQLKLNRIVAVKMILAGQFASPEHVQRFYSEAEAAANLDHPGIVPIYEVNEQDGQHFFSMGYVEGASLSERVKDGPLAPREAARLTRQVADAIQYAHDHRVIHRDLKPGNILMTADGQPRVTDFGLAKTVEGDSGLTATGQVLGTPSYMPPEQAAGRIEDVGPRSDIYSLGAVLYCLLTGRPPFQSASTVETIRQVLEREPPSPRLLNPSVDRDLETICLKCLEKDARNRYQSARELAAELQRFLAGEPIHARRIGIAVRGWRWCRRKPAVAALLFTVPMILLMGIAAAGFWYSGQQSRQLSGLDNRFEVGLDQIELDEAYLARMESLLTEMHILNPPHADQQQTRLRQRFSDELSAQIRRIRPTEEAIKKLESTIAAFEQRDSPRADEMRAELQRRMPEWRTVFEWPAESVNVADVFTSNEFTVSDGRLVHKPLDPENSSVHARAPAHGEIELTIVVASEWRQYARLALKLNDSASSGYRFSLEPSAFRRNMSQNLGFVDPDATFASVRDSDGDYQLTIYRHDAPLLRQPIAARSIPEGRLTLCARREQNVLSVQLNNGKTYTVRDPFPLNNRDSGAFGLDWPAGLPVESLRATRRAVGQAANDLERGDELFMQGNFAESLSFYEREAASAASETVRREAQYKAARSLLELGRRDEAAETLMRVFTASEDEWAPLAGCQLWLLRLEQDRWEESDEILDLLQSHYRFGELAALVPQEARSAILEKYLDGMRIGSMLRFDPARLRNAERAAAVDRLLSNDGHGDVMVQLEVTRAYRLAGDLEGGLQIAEKLARSTRHWNAIKHYARLLRQTGRAEQALQEIDLAINEARQQGREYTTFAAERARVLAALGRWEDCTRQLDGFIDTQLAKNRDDRPGSVVSPDYLNAAFMRGFIHERVGEPALAQRVWSDAFHAGERDYLANPVIGADIISLVIMGALTGEVRGDHLQQLINTASSGDQSPLVLVVRGLISQETINTTLREMWNDPLTRSTAEALAFESTSLRDRIRMPMILAGREYITSSIAPQGLTSEQDKLLLATVESLFDTLVEKGTFTSTQAAQLALTWKGTTSLFGWGGLRSTLAPDFRGPLSYFLAHRFLRRADKGAAADLFRQSLADADDKPQLAELARLDLELLEANEGMVAVSSQSPNAVNLSISQNGKLISTLAVPGSSATQRLPAGNYQLLLDAETQELSVSPISVTISAGERHPIAILWQAQSAESKDDANSSVQD